MKYFKNIIGNTCWLWVVTWVLYFCIVKHIIYENKWFRLCNSVLLACTLPITRISKQRLVSYALRICRSKNISTDIKWKGDSENLCLKISFRIHIRIDFCLFTLLSWDVFEFTYLKLKKKIVQGKHEEKEYLKHISHRRYMIWGQKW